MQTRGFMVLLTKIINAEVLLEFEEPIKGTNQILQQRKT